jgi:hypothetical protein
MNLTTATTAGVDAQIAFETVLRTFSSVPIAATSGLSTPTVTAMPTPYPPPTVI